MPVTSQDHCVFPVFRLLNDFFCLLTYEFCLSIWKIARCSVILLLPLCRLSISQDMCSMITAQTANLVSNQPLIEFKMFHHAKLSMALLLSIPQIACRVDYIMVNCLIDAVHNYIIKKYWHK